MIRRTFLVLAVALMPLLSAAPSVADTPSPADQVSKINRTLLSLMQAGKKTPFTTRMQMFLPVVQSVFDIPVVLRSAVGPRWSSIPEDQRAQVLDAFTQYTAASYVSNFDKNNGDRFEILPDLRAAGSDQIVQTRIVPKTGDPIRIDYVMRRTPDGWRAVDVLSEGISQVAVQRSDFRSLIREGDASQLISGLRDKVAKYSVGQSAAN